MKRVLTAAFVVVFVSAACGGASPARAAPTSSPPATPSPSETPDAGRTAAMQDNVRVVYGEKRRPAWWKFLAQVSGRPELAVYGTAVWVAAKPTITAALAASMCQDIAMAVFDDNAVPLGVRHVHIELLRDTSLRIVDAYLDLDVLASCNSRT